MADTINGGIKELRSELEQAVGRCAERIKEEELDLQNYQLKIMGLELKIGGIIYLGSASYQIESIASPDIHKQEVGMDNWLVRLKQTHKSMDKTMPEELIMEVE